MAENHHVPLGPPCPVEQTHAVCKGPQQSRRTSFGGNGVKIPPGKHGGDAMMQ